MPLAIRIFSNSLQANSLFFDKLAAIASSAPRRPRSLSSRLCLFNNLGNFGVNLHRNMFRVWLVTELPLTEGDRPSLLLIPVARYHFARKCGDDHRVIAAPLSSHRQRALRRHVAAGALRRCHRGIVSSIASSGLQIGLRLSTSAPATDDGNFAQSDQHVRGLKRSGIAAS